MPMLEQAQMTDKTITSIWPTLRWRVALGVGTLQIAVAGYAVLSSMEDILSDFACLGGYFGSVVNLAIGVAVVLWAMGLAVKTIRAAQWHPYIAPLLFLAASSATAICFGMYAALSCTV